MGYVELIRDTDQGKVAVILKDGERTVEKAEKCDMCYRWRPASMLQSISLYGSDEWIEECIDGCK